jgi:hypothetical protein
LQSRTQEAQLPGALAQKGLLLEINDAWAVARRCGSLETLARATGNPTVRLPAVATGSRPLQGSAPRHQAVGHDHAWP